jgi:hypothetical protein
MILDLSFDSLSDQARRASVRLMLYEGFGF